MKSDIEIARSIELTKIKQIARETGIPVEHISNYGRYIAKVDENQIDEEKVRKNNLILVTAITPTKAGIGKTTVSIGLALGLNRIGKKAIVALREPSLGPCFGMKGGAAGGGYAQVLPMDKINLHFTGDFHAITSAHNMISALLDNYLYQNRDNGFGLKEVLWKRVLDVNDRSLRYVVTGLGPKTNGITQESGFDITPASEIMAILCLANDEDDLRRRIENILLGFTYDNKPFTVKELLVTLNEGQMSADEAHITHDMQLIADALPEDTLFNFSALTAFSEDDPEAACSIIRTFIEETGKNADRMQQALTDREVDGIAAMAHKLLPLFTLIGASESVASLRWLESCRGEEFSEEIEKTTLETLEAVRKVVRAAEEYSFGLH